MSKNFDYATLVILDVGTNVSGTGEKPSFFQQAHQCAARIIERNIMIQSKNLVGLILMGSKKSNNELALQCPGSFKYIDMKYGLMSPTWDMIKDLPKETNEKKSDWFEALIVAAHHFKDGISGCKIASKKIVLLTNFVSPAKISSNFDDVVAGFQEDNLEVYVIGPDLGQILANGSPDIEPVLKFIEATNGDRASFEEAMSGWLFHKKKASKHIPQNFDLGIGSNVKIPVSIYIRVKDEPVVKSWQKAVKDPVTSTASTTEGVKTERKIVNTENQAVFEKGDIIQGYLYGQNVIPFGDSDKTMLYESGERSLSVYGFTKANNIQWQALSGDCTYYIFGRKGDKKASYAVNCLVHCLHSLKLAGIVRKVHSRNSEPKMFALFPVVDSDGFICLSMIGICYKEEIKHMAFPPSDLKKYNCTEEQVNAFKDLINAMDLTNAYDDPLNDSEAFPVAETVSPSIQYVLDCIAYRAMNPDKPLPQPRDEIMILFKVPPLLEKMSRTPIENLKKQFNLVKIENKTRSRKNVSDLKNNDPVTDIPQKIDVDIPKVKLPMSDSSDVTRIGTIDPVNNFAALLGKGKTVTELSNEVTSVIENLVYTNFSNDFSKAINTMSKYRQECVNKSPTLYNTWLKKFKGDLIDRKRKSFLDAIVEQNVNFILKSENAESEYTEDNSSEDKLLAHSDTTQNSAQLTIQDDVNDLFDEM